MSDNYWARSGRISRRDVFRGGAGLGAGLLAAGLIGCGGDDGTADTPAGGGGGGTGTAPAGSAGTMAPSDGEPRMGGTLNYASGSAIAHFDPHQSTTPASQTNLWHLIGNQLVRMHASDLLVEGDLARDWETPEPNVFTFNMHEAHFQEGPPLEGRQITAEDVVYSYQRTQTDDPNYARRSQYDNVERFEAIDDTTVQITLTEPSVPFLAVLADIYETVVAQEVVEQHGDLKLVEAAHGGGPFIVDLDTFDKTVGGKFTRNPNYWKKDEAGNQLPYLDGIEYQFIGDAAAQYAALTTGKVDVGGLSPENEEDFRQANPDWQYNDVPGLSRDGLLLHTEKPPFDDIRVRQAVSYLLDRYLIRDLGRGRGDITPAVAPAMEFWTLPPEELATYPGYRNPDDAEAIEQDRAEGMKLLDAAGYADGFELDMFSTTSYGYNLLAETASAQLEQYGIKLNLVLQEWGILKEHENLGTYTIAASNWYSGPEPDLHLFLYHHRDGGRSYGRLNDPDLNSLLERQRVEFDQDARRELIFEAQRKIIELAAPVWVLAPSGVGTLAPYVRNYGARKVAAAWGNEVVWLANA